MTHTLERTRHTARLIEPVLVDAETGQVAAIRTMPWYITALSLSQPLHFGDYGGILLKILWALLNLITVFVLVSGLYLWWNKRKLSVEQLLTKEEPLRSQADTPDLAGAMR